MSSDPLGTWITGWRPSGWLGLAAYCGPNSYRGLWAATSLRRGTTVNASQLPLPRLYSSPATVRLW